MKKIIIITISIFLLFGIWQNIYAGELLLKYPEIKGLEPGKGEAATLPGIIKYIYLFALGAIGVIALLSILIGAIKYTTAAGNVSQVEDAKEQIKQALLGVIILLASVLILSTINPDLVNFEFKLPKITSGPPGPNEEKEIKEYACYCCCYIGVNCNPNQPEHRQWCVSNLTKSQAQNDCYSECDYSCGWPQGYVANVVQESCD